MRRQNNKAVDACFEEEVQQEETEEASQEEPRRPNGEEDLCKGAEQMAGDPCTDWVLCNLFVLGLAMIQRTYRAILIKVDSNEAEDRRC